MSETRFNRGMKRYLPLAILFALLLLFSLTGWHKLFSLQMLRDNHDAIKDYVKLHRVSAALLYVLIYILMTALTLPGGLLLSLVGGYLFAQPWSTLFVVFGATTGATCLFLAARSALGGILRKKASPFLAKMRAGFEKNAPDYMLFLRFVPLFPFWLVNLAPAFFDLRVGTFLWTTALGVLPGSFAYTQAGEGLRLILERGETLTLETVLNRNIRLALVALGLMALLPVAIKIRRRKHDR